jgi:hypothetical protein
MRLVVIISQESDTEGAAATAKPVDRPVRPGKQFEVTFQRELQDDHPDRTRFEETLPNERWSIS